MIRLSSRVKKVIGYSILFLIWLPFFIASAKALGSWLLAVAVWAFCALIVWLFILAIDLIERD
jgi:hypothetical protein